MGKLLPFKQDIRCFSSQKELADSGASVPVDTTDYFITDFLPHAENVVILYEDKRDGLYYVLHNAMSQERFKGMITSVWHEAMSDTLNELRED